MLKTLTLPSGTKMQIALASWRDAGVLRRTIAQELKTVKLELSDTVLAAILTKGPDGNIDKQAVMAAIGGHDIDSLKNAALQLLSSEALEAAVFDCMSRCLLGQEKITDKTFEPEEARADFYPAAWEVIRLNLTPFSKSLSFMSPTAKPAAPTSPG